MNTNTEYEYPMSDHTIWLVTPIIMEQLSSSNLTKIWDPWSNWFNIKECIVFAKNVSFLNDCGDPDYSIMEQPWLGYGGVFFQSANIGEHIALTPDTQTKGGWQKIHLKILKTGVMFNWNSLKMYLKTLFI